MFSFLLFLKFVCDFLWYKVFIAFISFAFKSIQACRRKFSENLWKYITYITKFTTNVLQQHCCYCLAYILLFSLCFHDKCEYFILKYKKLDLPPKAANSIFLYLRYNMLFGFALLAQLWERMEIYENLFQKIYKNFFHLEI